jgi:hypothetical protein
MYAAGMRDTEKGKKRERVRPFSAKMKPEPKRSRFRLVYGDYGNS